MTSVRDFGARGDGKTDDAQAIQHAIQKGDGVVHFPRGNYLISRTIRVPLQMHGRISIDGALGTAKLIMAGAGPALNLIGSHRRTAEPSHFAEEQWQRERMPIVQGLEIVGRHAQADGIRAEGVMQPTFHQLLIRKCRYGIHLNVRDRNVLISNCHIYDNSAIGVFLDAVNLHQINIHGNHISYCKQAGIKILASEVRNIQICANDIEYNHDLKGQGSADVFFDCRAGTVREGTLVGNTVQARESPGGANVRFLGAKDHPNAVGLFTISANLIGSQARALDLHNCRAVVITGNSIYSGYRHSIWAENAEHLVIGANTIDHNPEYRGNSTDQLVLRNCRNVSMTGLILQHTRPANDPVTSSMEIRGCHNVNIAGIQIINARGRGIALESCQTVRIADSTIRGTPDDKAYRAAVTVDGKCAQVMVVNNFLGRGSDGAFTLPAVRGTASGNVMV
ncbi:MAG: right-handed parallel beta-helix repeat-containing protein [Planctomycetes bacterium]|nr:right-handed parallel beta-helix repeat-containing protein [Planctomycetota bacterium]